MRSSHKREGLFEKGLLARALNFKKCLLECLRVRIPQTPATGNAAVRVENARILPQR